METKKATLNVNGRSYPVLVHDVGDGFRGAQSVKLDWERLRGLYGSRSSEQLFNQFILDIAHTPAYWLYDESKYSRFGVNPKWITYEPEEEVLPPMPEETEVGKRLRIVGNRLENGFRDAGLELVRVEHSQDVYEGTITLQYKKEETK